MASFSFRKAESLSDAYYSSDGFLHDDHYDDCDPEELCYCEELRRERDAIRQASNLDIDY